MKNRTLFILVVILTVLNLQGQLGNNHWLPPIHSRSAEDVEDHYVYLSTPSEEEFEVTLNFGNTVLTSRISKGNPSNIFIGNGISSNMFVLESNLNSPQENLGIRLTAPEEFYASFRVRSEAQAGYLTTKGEAALGTSFRLGSLPQGNEVEDKNFFTSIMATVDNTTITINDFDTSVVFAGPNAPLTDDITVILNEGETYTVSGYTTQTGNYTGFIGTLVNSDKPIVVNTGNALGGFPGYNGRDYTIDQIVPVSEVGNEYIVVEGNGNTVTETPMVIATEPDTDVFVNGIFYSNLANAGDYLLISNPNYRGTSHRNMYINTSKNVYLYQFLAGSDSEATVGMNFIPPLSCFFQREVDMIPDVDQIGNTRYEGDIIAVTRSGATLSINGNTISQSPETVIGDSDWVTYRVSGYSGNVSIVSTDAVSVGVFGFNGSAGFAGYYSGFGAIPKDTDIDVCDDGLTDLFLEIDGNPIEGGVWTDPNGTPHSGFFDPSTDILGSYNYFLNSACAVIDVDVNVIRIIPSKNPGLDNALDICENEGPIDLLAQLSGTPDLGGEWRNAEGTVFDGIFDPAIDESGVHSYGFYDNAPCDVVEAFIDINVLNLPESIEAVLLTPELSPNSSSIEVLTIGSEGLYEYQLDDGPWQENNIFNGVPNGNHTVNVRDLYGCNYNASDTIFTLSYPTFFTPNGDGTHDTWKIEGLGETIVGDITIYDRYGRLLHQVDPLERGWDGFYLNKEMPSSDYWFQVTYVADNDENKVFKSHFTLKR